MTDPKNLETVRALLNRSRKDLMERHQAEGVGIGRQGDEYVIVVYLRSATQRPKKPESLEGVPLKFEVTGPFTTQTS
jgi:hypothetical protein